MSDPNYRAARMTVDEYLRREERADVRHEYVSGLVYAMTGATVRHNKIAFNVGAHLRAAAARGACQVFMNDLKVCVADERFYYPDVVVTCVPIGDDDVFTREPCLVVEVTSPSTRATDRREKLVEYGKLPSLQAYLIVDHRRRFVEVYRRDEGGLRLRAGVGGDERVDLPCPRTALTLDIIYAGVTPPTIRERSPTYVTRPR